MKSAILIMAAGLSSRFRRTGHGNKLSALINEKPVLRHAFDNARATGTDVFVLTRPEDKALHQLIPPLNLLKYLSEGLGDSIAAAVRAVPDYDGWLIALGDMPFISPSSYQALSRALETSPVVRAEVNGVYGHPVGFRHSFLEQLSALSGEKGSFGLLNSGTLRLVSLEDRGCLIDIDTYDDLIRLGRED